MSRWTVLLILFFARTGMGFQYQTPAAVAPLLQSQYSVALDQIGLLIGVYFITGLGLAIPTAALGSLLNEKRAVSIGLALMALGGVCSALSPAWTGFVTARVIAGTGGVLVNVLMTKMAADWFSDGALATAMAIFVNSWPVGIAIGLLVIPSISLTFGTSAVFYIGALWAAGALCLVQVLPPPPSRQVAGLPAKWPDRRNGLLVALAGLVWAFFNAAFVVVFSFGPAMLREEGMSLIGAGGAVSLVLWFSIAGVFVGGVLSDKLRAPTAIIAACGVLIIAAILYAGNTSPSFIAFAAIGVLIGLPAGAIMALPARLLPVPERVRGMGYFYTVFYAVIVLSPVAAGALAVRTGSANTAFQTSAILMTAGLFCFAVLKTLERRWRPQSIAAA